MQKNRGSWWLALVCVAVLAISGCGEEATTKTGRTPSPGDGAAAQSATGGGGNAGPAQAEVTVTDAPEAKPLTWLDNKEAMDVQSVHFAGQDGTLTVTVTLDRPYAKILDANNWACPPVEIFLDIDDNAKTGGKTWMGDKPGFEYKLKPLAGVELSRNTEGGESKMQLYEGGGRDDDSVVGYLPTYSIEKFNAGESFSSTTIWGMDKDALAASSIDGNDLIVKVPYARLGLTAGQPVRLLVMESHATGSPEDIYMAECRLLPE